MSRERDASPDKKIFVGGISRDTDERELKEEFSRFGHISNVWISRDRPGFGFIVFEDSRDADEACRSMNGRTVCGASNVRVEPSGAKPRGRGGPRGGGFRNGGRGNGGACYSCGENGHFARECPNSRDGGRGGGGGGGGGRDRGRDDRDRGRDRDRDDRRSRGGYRRDDDRSRSPRR